MIFILIIIAALGILIFAFMQLPRFGSIPSGERLEKIKKSSHYKNGAFHNQKYTPVMTKDANFFKIFKDFFFTKSKRVNPINDIPSQKTDLLKLNPAEDILVWFGHSSYFIQIDGQKILVDPVFSKHASPVSFTIKAFKGTFPYSPDDIPEIDYLFITHDHWDHLDYKTVMKLKPKIKKVICALGVGAHFERWGFDNTKIIEHDWDEEIPLDKGFAAYTVPSRHFSGRGFLRNKSLWTSFALITPTMKIFLGCDGGYDTHFTETEQKFGAFDLAIIENGQYNKSWKYIHMSPEESFQSALDLHAERFLPIHSSKFALSIHDWDEPLKRITELNKDHKLQIITPMIGELVNLKDQNQQFIKWWENIK